MDSHPSRRPVLCVLQAFLRLRARFDGLAGWRSSVVRGELRWRLAVLVGKSAHGSESLRMRLGGRLAAAFGGCLRSKAGLRRAPQRGGRLRSDCGAAVRGGSALLPRVVRGCGAWLAASRCLWSPSVLCPTPRMRLTEADRSGGIKPDHSCCGPAAFGLTPPARPAWASPAYAAWDPEHNTLMVRRVHRTAWSAQVAPKRTPT